MQRPAIEAMIRPIRLNRQQHPGIVHHRHIGAALAGKLFVVGEAFLNQRMVGEYPGRTAVRRPGSPEQTGPFTLMQPRACQIGIVALGEEGSEIVIPHAFGQDVIGYGRGHGQFTGTAA